MSVQAHYEHLLADHYSWSLGDFSARVTLERDWLRARGIETNDGALALDLGAGAGCHAMALSGLGFRVTAVDTSPKLVHEMLARAHEAGVVVEAATADMIEFVEGQSERAAVVVCMGDTLTHLESKERVRQMFRAVRARLDEGGCFVVTYRDLATELTGLDRFFPVRADDNAVFTCFVEYLPGRVMVHDVVYVRDASGWHMKKSAYPKLRMGHAEVEEWLTGAGFSKVECVAAPRGLTGLVAR